MELSVSVSGYCYSFLLSVLLSQSVAEIDEHTIKLQYS